MDCDEFQQMTSTYIDDELSDEDARLLFAHLAECVSCRGFLRDCLHFRSAASLLPEPKIPPSLDRRVKGIPRRKERRGAVAVLLKTWKERVTVPVPAFALALILLVVSTAFVLVRVTGEEPRTVSLLQLPAVDVHPLPSP